MLACAAVISRSASACSRNPWLVRRSHRQQLEFGNIAVSSCAAPQAVPRRFGSFPRTPLAAEIRYWVIGECGVAPVHPSIEHQQRGNELGWGAADDGVNSGTAMDADASPRLQCICGTPPNTPSVVYSALCITGSYLPAFVCKLFSNRYEVNRVCITPLIVGDCWVRAQRSAAMLDAPLESPYSFCIQNKRPCMPACRTNPLRRTP